MCGPLGATLLSSLRISKSRGLPSSAHLRSWIQSITAAESSRSIFCGCALAAFSTVLGFSRVGRGLPGFSRPDRARASNFYAGSAQKPNQIGRANRFSEAAPAQTPPTFFLASPHPPLAPETESRSSYTRPKAKVMSAIAQLDDETVHSMAVGAIFNDYVGKISSLDFHRTEDLLITSCEDDSIRLYNITNATLLKTTYHKKHGADRVCFTHHPSSILCSSRYDLESTESLRYLSMYDNRCLRYFKGHKERVVSLCMSPINDSFMSGSLDHSVRLWDLRVNACQGILRLRGRPTVAYDQQGLVFAVAMEGGAIKLFDSRSYDKGPFDTFLVGGDTAEVCDIKFSNDGKSMLLTTTNNNIYVLDAYGGEKRCGFSLEPSPNLTSEATFTPDGQYVVSGSGDGTLHAWNINKRNEVACWNSYIGVVTCLKWAPRRAMFATASTVLTFWIPNQSKSNEEPSTAEAGHGE